MDTNRKVTLEDVDQSVSGGAEMVPSEPKLLLTIEETAHLLGVNRSTVYDLIGCGDLPSVKIGRRRLVYRQSLINFIIRCESDGTP